MLLGTQKGTILLGKVVKGEDSQELNLKIINSYNRFCNFMVTNISVMPNHETSIVEKNDPENIPSLTEKNHFLFAYSTADGYIKVQNTKESFPMYSYQSISVSSSKNSVQKLTFLENDPSIEMGFLNTCHHFLRRKREILP